MNVRDALHKAVSSFQAGHLGQVESICRKVLKAHRDQPDALHLLGVVAFQHGNHQRAVELIEKALQRSPDSASFHVNLGEAYRGLGRLDRANSHFERSLEIDPDRAEAHCGLGNGLLALGKIDDALASYDRAIEINPTMAQAHYNQGNALSEQGDLDDAIAAYRRAIAINPSFADANFNLGNALSARGRLVAAITAYEAALQAAPHLANGWYNLGNALRKLGRLEGARKAYARAVELDAGLAGAHVHLGTIAKLQGRLDGALTALDRAMEIEPDNALAHSERAHVLLLQGKTKDSIDGYQHAVATDPRFAWGYMGLSTALAAGGRLSEAKQASREAINLRRTFDWPFLGREPVGRVLVLKGLEDSHFTIGDGDEITFKGGVNNIDTHFDRTRVAQCSFYVDGLDVGGDLDNFPDCDVIFNGISDPDTTPASHAVAKRLAEAAVVPIINHPDQIALTQRDKNYETMHGIDGILFPRTLRLENPISDKREVIRLLDEAALDPPVLIRCAGTHTGETLEKIAGTDQILDYFRSNPAGPYYLTPFIDYAHKSGNYIKMRMFVVDGELHPNHLYIFDDWRVSQGDQVLPLMSANNWMLDEAKAFLNDPEGYLGQERFRAVQSACSSLDLEYFGIDFACLADGRALVFEANPLMRLPSPTRDIFAFRKPYTESIVRALTRLLEKKIKESKTWNARA